jgi:hypothetical protein
MGQIQIDGFHQLSFRANALKESDQLELEKHNWVDGWAAYG